MTEEEKKEFEEFLEWKAEKKRKEEEDKKKQEGAEKQEKNDSPNPNVEEEKSEELDKKDKINLLKKYYSVLSPREKDIIYDRYGIKGEELTQKKIAKKMGISRSYVSRIEKRALAKILREFIKNDKV